MGLNPYQETAEEIALILAEMKEYFCIQNRLFSILAKVANGGERYGHEDFGLRAKNGQMICYNPRSGYRWVMGADFPMFYCRKGCQLPASTPKLQQDGARKGQSRHLSASNAAESVDDFELEEGE